MEQAAAAAEVRGEGEIGEVFGRPLSDFDETPPVLLECMGWVPFFRGGKILVFMLSVFLPIFIYILLYKSEANAAKGLILGDGLKA